MARPIVKLDISEEQRRELLRMVLASTTVPRELPRARVMLLRSEGKSQKEAGLEVGLGVVAVRLWEQRFRTRGVAGLEDTVGHNRKVPVSPETVQRVVIDALQPPPQGTHWTLNSMARHAGISQTQVQRIWSVNGIKPHVAHAVELARDTDFAARFWDVIGLYLNPPDRALVLCTDGKGHRLALQRAQPALPLGIGPIPNGAGDFVSQEISRLFAALYYLDGKVISRLAARPEHAGLRRFLEWVHRGTPRALQVHLIADNTGTHEHPEVEQWLAEHPPHTFSMFVPPGWPIGSPQEDRRRQAMAAHPQRGRA